MFPASVGEPDGNRALKFNTNTCAESVVAGLVRRDPMVNNCANPDCAKPLHYLREGRIFVFDVSASYAASTSEKRSHQLEHYWLCGVCAQHFLVERKGGEPGVRLVAKPTPATRMKVQSITNTALAS